MSVSRNAVGSAVVLSVSFFVGCSTQDAFTAHESGASEMDVLVTDSQPNPNALAESPTSNKPSMLATPMVADPAPVVSQLPSVDPAEPGESATLVSTSVASGIERPWLIDLSAGQSLQKVVSDSPNNVIIDFYADWCGPCRVQGKILHELEEAAIQSGATIVKIDVDQHPELAEQFSVASLPTILVVKDGRVADRQVGVSRKSRLVAWMR